ncbi:MAG: hypothetical protein P8Y94_14800 [Acidobacteriota bacterium]
MARQSETRHLYLCPFAGQTVDLENLAVSQGDEDPAGAGIDRDAPRDAPEVVDDELRHCRPWPGTTQRSKISRQAGASKTRDTLTFGDQQIAARRIEHHRVGAIQVGHHGGRVGGRIRHRGIVAQDLTVGLVQEEKVFLDLIRILRVGRHLEGKNLGNLDT